MKTNKVKRSNNYMKRNRKRRIALKISMSALCVIVSVGIIVFAFSLNSNTTKTTSAKPEISQTKVETSIIKTENSEPLENKPKRDPSLPDYSNSFKYTEKLIKDTELSGAIDSKYSILYDVTNDTILFKKSAEEKCYPASTTKLLTAIVASKILKEDAIITVGDEITMIGEDSSIAELKKGQKLTTKQLMYAMLLPSGNDAAYTLAVATARSYKNDEKLSQKEAIKIFTSLMNDAAKELGAVKSHFTNPDGFHDDNHYTTALDLLKIANYAKNIPLIAEICNTHQTIQTLKSGETVTWVNSNKLLNEGEYCYSKYADGMKTGFTDEAGTCVIASYTKEKNTQIVVAMNSSELYKKYYDTLKLAKLGFNQNSIEFIYDELPDNVNY